MIQQKLTFLLSGSKHKGSDYFFYALGQIHLLLDIDCQNSKNLLTVTLFSRGLFFTPKTDFDLWLFGGVLVVSNTLLAYLSPLSKVFELWGSLLWTYRNIFCILNNYLVTNRALFASKLRSWFRGPLLCRDGPLHTLARASSGWLGGWRTFDSVTELSRPLSRAQLLDTIQNLSSQTKQTDVIFSPSRDKVVLAVWKFI